MVISMNRCFENKQVSLYLLAVLCVLISQLIVTGYNKPHLVLSPHLPEQLFLININHSGLISADHVYGCIKFL